MRKFTSTIGLIALCMAAIPASGHAQTAPVEAYAALPAIDSVAVSPDGSSLAYLRRGSDGVSVIAQARTGEPLVTIDVSDRVARGVFWASPDHVVISSTVNDKLPYTTKAQLYQQLDIVNVRTRRVARALRSADKAILTANFGPPTIGTWRGEPVMFLRTYTVENSAWTYDVYRVNLDDGRGRLHQTGAEDTRGYVVSRTGEVVARSTYDDRTGLWRLLAANGANWRELLSRRSLLDPPAMLGFGRTRDTILVQEDRDEGPVVFEVALSDGAETVLEDAAAAETIVRDSEGLMIGVGLQGLTRSYRLFDPALQANWQTLETGLPGRQLTLSDSSDDNKVLVFHSEGAGDPGAAYVFDDARRSVSLVGRAYPSLQPSDVGQVSVVRYRAADGMELFGYLTRPSTGSTNLPLILMPHGGPASRDSAGFDWWAQAMASRGYAVFQPQFRGSDGFGHELLEAGYGEYGRKMQTDLSDAVRHLASAGVIDPARVCIVGASYGGYAALAGMTLDSGVYRCAVSVAGVSDLPVKLMRERQSGGQARYNPAMRYWQRFMGVDDDQAPLLAELSPSRLADRVQGPILLIHGRDDTVVPFEQSEIMATALRRAGKPVELIALNGEDHYLTFAATRRQMLVESLKFLELHNPPN
ncbi:alpha/beta hydrolase family protein [Brevundimonas sp. NPDC092305]|uniref:alpha/beta hydrolase family protein n=1 Tax=Brevundimonas sp. NPDC092305 TaxID=3363957 RepID=UPI00382391DE